MQRYLDAILVKPNKLPKKVNIKNDLKTKQEIVGGKIEYTYLPDCYDIVIICNEEGKLLGLPLNRDIGHDIIMGDFLIVGDDPEQGEDRSLTKEQIEKYTKMFGIKSMEKTKETVNKMFSNNYDNYEL